MIENIIMSIIFYVIFPICFLVILLATIAIIKDPSKLCFRVKIIDDKDKGSIESF